MVSEDSRQHLGQRSESLLPLHGRVHRIRLLDDACQAVRGPVFPALHHLQYFAKPQEGFACIGRGEGKDIFFEEGHQLLPKATPAMDGVDEAIGVAGLGIDAPRLKDLLCQLQNVASTLVLYKVELGVNIVAISAGFVVFDADKQGAFAFDEACEEPLCGFSAGESFLLVGSTHRVFTSSVAWDTRAVPAYSRILQRPCDEPLELRPAFTRASVWGFALRLTPPLNLRALAKRRPLYIGFSP